MLRNGTTAPHFVLKDSDGNDIQSTRYEGKPLVMLFFRGMFCPTTPRYLTAYQDFYARIKDMGMELIGLSYDSQENHAKLKASHGLKYSLLSDPGCQTLEKYGLYIDQNTSDDDYGEPAIVIVDKNSQVAYSAVSSGAKGLPDPGAIAPILIYMAFHGGVY